jgi:IS5 family transposase
MGGSTEEARTKGSRCSVDPEAGQGAPGEGDRSKAKVEIAIPVFGYKTHISIDRRHGFVRRFTVTSAASHDGPQLANVLDPANTASDVWADTAYRSKANEAHLAKHRRRSKIHFRRQPGHDLTPSQRKANRARSKVRSAVETVFAGQKHRFGLFVRTIGLARAQTKIGLANLANNLKRFLWIEARPVAARSNPGNGLLSP